MESKYNGICVGGVAHGRMVFSNHYTVKFVTEPPLNYSQETFSVTLPALTHHLYVYERYVWNNEVFGFFSPAETNVKDAELFLALIVRLMHILSGQQHMYLEDDAYEEYLYHYKNVFGTTKV